ncbi:unnamed protein product [Didymodactylos carnosus]|uniref:Phosphoglycerate mutase n=1 Tax=Didymodactylos carnosus TaxID=1234261 RepID=A0A815IQN2_9BILA|nr:unnamed protein product [Didymodactylos carnosus]CAF1372059.1 unnamed protein product [Didymodactylos carnosus]CAF3638215.1 unnamed protein product [Didymodactylos carnosus]CAF4259546.1 unnamed protein product [Didymodactylos carnosus]
MPFRYFGVPFCQLSTLSIRRYSSDSMRAIETSNSLYKRFKCHTCEMHIDANSTQLTYLRETDIFDLQGIKEKFQLFHNDFLVQGTTPGHKISIIVAHGNLISAFRYYIRSGGNLNLTLPKDTIGREYRLPSHCGTTVILAKQEKRNERMVTSQLVGVIELKQAYRTFMCLRISYDFVHKNGNCSHIRTMEKQQIIQSFLNDSQALNKTFIKSKLEKAYSADIKTIGYVCEKMNGNYF